MWKRLGAVAPVDLGPGRLYAHALAQVPAAAARAAARPAPDDGHTALRWEADSRQLSGASVGTGDGALRFAVDVERGVLLADDGRSRVEIPPAGRTLDALLLWGQALIAERAGCSGVELSRPDYDLPNAGPFGGTTFGEAPADPLVELGRWFDNAASRFAAVRGAHAEALPVRCWPHHFDLATLIALDPPGDDDARSIGVGMSPGDGNYAEPYWYVAPWPYPSAGDLPALALGHWHTEGFTAAVLTGSELVASTGDAPSQERAVDTFLGAAIGTSRDLLG